MIPIAQQTAQEASADILWMLGLVVVLAFVVAGVAWLIRKRTVGAEDPATPGLTLSDLRQMHREGRMTDEEFDAATPGSGDAGENPASDSDKNGEDEPPPPGA